MSQSSRVLVVGSTSDYIEWLRQRAPGRALFLTDRQHRAQAFEPPPPRDEEVLADLADFDEVERRLRAFLTSRSAALAGVTCFDCESLELAAVLAASLGLAFPSREAIRVCRDKQRQRSLWQSVGLPCPRAARVRTEAEARAFLQEMGGTGVVLKPTTGAGSELVFHATDPAGCARAFQEIQRGLAARADNRMYRCAGGDAPGIVAEERVQGVEHSCDFVLQDGRVRILRLTRKILSTDGPFGTVRGYVMPTTRPAALRPQRLARLLRRSAESLGVHRAICMLDFFVVDRGIVLLELAPRPGGDCIPPLLRRTRGLDMLVAALDFAVGRPVRLPTRPVRRVHVGLRLHASQGGVIRSADPAALAADARVCEVQLIRGPGHVVRLPPEDYDSWLLGHAVFVPDARGTVAAQCEELHRSLRVEMQG